MAESSEEKGGEELLANFVSDYYWGEHDYDPAAWLEEFHQLVTDAHTGRKKNKQALKKYRDMRMAVAAKTSRFTITAPNNCKPYKDEVAVSITGCRGGEPYADPIAVAAYVDFPLLVPVHHGEPSPDGDLESECYRRCSPSGWPGQSKAVVRGPESAGYPIFAIQRWWAIHLIEYPQPATIKSSQLLVRQGRESLEASLRNAITSSDCAYQDGIVLTGLPFCRRNDSDDTIQASARLTVGAFQKVGIQKVVLVGKYATDTANILQKWVETLKAGISVSKWAGPGDDDEESNDAYRVQYLHEQKLT